MGSSEVMAMRTGPVRVGCRQASCRNRRRVCQESRPDVFGLVAFGLAPVRFDEGRELADLPRSAPAYSTVLSRPFGFAYLAGSNRHRYLLSP